MNNSSQTSRAYRYSAATLLLLACIFMSPTAQAQMCLANTDCMNPAVPYCDQSTMMCSAFRGCTSDADCTDPARPKCNQATMTCRAQPFMCQSDADCNDPAYPNCDTDLQECVAPPAQSLVGLIVDRADGSTPVHPVEISLLSPLTGIPTGVMTTNNSDGSWSLNPLDQEPKLVLFNATGGASQYVDELYDKIPCEGGCDAAILGTAVAINPGENTLNYDLAVGYTISGTVRDEFVNPMQEVLLEVFDEAGKLIATVQTNGLGQWSLSKLRSQDYYVRTVPWTTPGYVPEIWDNKSCWLCDVLTTGDPITVNNADRSIIDFLLEPRPELIFESGFESPPP